MNNKYNNYVSGVQTQVIEKEKHDFLSTAIPLISEFKSIAEKNQDNLKTFKGINQELLISIERDYNDIVQLNNLLSTSRRGFNELSALKSKISELEFHPTSSDFNFNSKVNNLINEAYNHMTISKIKSTQSSIQNLIREMEQFEVDQKKKEEEKKNQKITYVINAIMALVGLFIIIKVIIPFIMNWGFLILVVVGFGWLISKSD